MDQLIARWIAIALPRKLGRRCKSRAMALHQENRKSGISVHIAPNRDIGRAQSPADPQL
jgi:hypothetical protein